MNISKNFLNKNKLSIKLKNNQSFLSVHSIILQK